MSRTANLNSSVCMEIVQKPLIMFVYTVSGIVYLCIVNRSQMDSQAFKGPGQWRIKCRCQGPCASESHFFARGNSCHKVETALRVYLTMMVSLRSLELSKLGNSLVSAKVRSSFSAKHFGRNVVCEWHYFGCKISLIF